MLVQCVVTVCVGTVCWYSVLVQCVGTVCLFSVLVQCVGTVCWYSVLVQCVCSVCWYSVCRWEVEGFFDAAQRPNQARVGSQPYTGSKGKIFHICTFPQNNIIQNSLNFLLFLTVRNRDPTESDPESGGRGWGWPAGEVRLFNNAENKNRFTRETYK